MIWFLSFENIVFNSITQRNKCTDNQNSELNVTFALLYLEFTFKCVWNSELFIVLHDFTIKLFIKYPPHILELKNIMKVRPLIS